MTQKSLRRFWQIHLSTAVVLMLVAAIFVGLDIQIIDGSMCGTGWNIVAAFAPIEVGFLFLIRFICEWLIRRGEAMRNE